MTEWRAIPGYEGRYEVSNEGDVNSLLFEKTRRLKPGTARGYPYVILHDSDRKSKGWTIHRLVLLAFRGPSEKGMVARHLDGSRTNNNLTNLLYGTYSQNYIDAVWHGTRGPRINGRKRAA